MLFRNRQFIDIAVNLTDSVFFGVDRKGKKIHDSDIDLVIERAITAGVDKMIITGTDVEISTKAVAMCRQYPGKLFCTVGVHPAHSDHFLSEETKARVLASLAVSKKQMNKSKTSQQAPAGVKHSPSAGANHLQQKQQVVASAPSLPVDPTIANSVISQLRDLAVNNRDVVVAIGECGLDYAELAPTVTPQLQAVGFQLQARLARELNLPLLLHSRDCGMDFVKEMKIAFPDGDHEDEERERESASTEAPSTVTLRKMTMMKGVIHSFNGSDEELSSLLQMKSIKNYFGLNASAFRDESVAKAVAKLIPDDRLMLESDSPWCAPKVGDWGYAAADRLALRESGGVTAAASRLFLVEPKRGDKPPYDLPPVVDKANFEMGKRVDKRNEPCALPAVFAQLCCAKGLLGDVSARELSDDGGGDDDEVSDEERKHVEILHRTADALAARIYQNVMDVFFFPSNES